MSNNLLLSLKLACVKNDTTVAEFARSIGRSRTTVVNVASERITSAYVLSKIQEFISETEDKPNVILLPAQWLTTRQVAKKTGMRPESVANKARSGGFERVKRIGKRWMIHKSELEVQL